MPWMDFVPMMEKQSCFTMRGYIAAMVQERGSAAKQTSEPKAYGLDRRVHRVRDDLDAEVRLRLDLLGDRGMTSKRFIRMYVVITPEVSHTARVCIFASPLVFK